jgi:hypothetical protein
MIWRGLFKDEIGVWRWRDILATCLTAFALLIRPGED